MKVTAIARANIALVKYWGNRDPALNIPASGSLSVTLEALETRTTAASGDGSGDRLTINGALVGEASNARMKRVLDAIRALPGAAQNPLRIESTNNFPTAAGLASSASGMAALAAASARALGLDPPPEQLSALARLGSGSACRSIFGGFVQWLPGERLDGADSHGAPLFAPEHWDLRVVVAVVEAGRKAVSSADGMAHTAATSPYHPAWLASAEADLAAAREAIAGRDLAALGAVAERSCLRMHANMAAADPPLVYLGDGSWRVIQEVRRLQDAGVAAFFTADAGPNVKVFCEPDAEEQVARAVGKLGCVKNMIHARIGQGVRFEA